MRFLCLSCSMEESTNDDDVTHIKEAFKTYKVRRCAECGEHSDEFWVTKRRAARAGKLLRDIKELTD